jgi:hypothetical protein
LPASERQQGAAEGKRGGEITGDILVDTGFDAVDALAELGLCLAKLGERGCEVL